MSNFQTRDIKFDQIEHNILILRNDLLNVKDQLKQTLEEKISNLESIFLPNSGLVIKNIDGFNGTYIYVENVFAFFTNDYIIDIEHNEKRSIFISEDINSIIIYSNNGWLIVKYDSLNIQHFLDINNNINFINNIHITSIYELTTYTHERSRYLSIPAPNDNITEF